MESKHISSYFWGKHTLHKTRDVSQTVLTHSLLFRFCNTLRLKSYHCMGALGIRDVTYSMTSHGKTGKSVADDKYRLPLTPQGLGFTSHLISEPLNVSCDAGQVSRFYSVCRWYLWWSLWIGPKDDIRIQKGIIKAISSEKKQL